ncbi:MAG: hypothetical protein ACJ735_07510 [Actinomycetes bacterium]
MPASPDPSTDSLRAAALIYRAAGEVCVGRLTSAARDVQVNVPNSGWTDCTGQPVLLQRWVRLMIQARQGDASATRAVRKFPRVSYACVTASPSPSPSPAPTESASPAGT